MWFITTTPAFPGELGFKRVWVTRRDTVVDDAMAMVAVVVEGIPTIVQRVAPATDEQVDCQFVDLSQLSSPDQSNLYRLTSPNISRMSSRGRDGLGVNSEFNEGRWQGPHPNLSLCHHAEMASPIIPALDRLHQTGVIRVRTVSR